MAAVNVIIKHYVYFIIRFVLPDFIQFEINLSLD